MCALKVSPGGAGQPLFGEPEAQHSEVAVHFVEDHEDEHSDGHNGEEKHKQHHDKLVGRWGNNGAISCHRDNIQ